MDEQHPESARTNDPTSAGGFPGFDELLKRYSRRSGRDISDAPYYRGFAAWRLAIIGEGVADRHRQRHPDDVASLRASQAGVAALAESALAVLREAT
jgi:aminoglycoside phosphotransferase (APT) family kinase protein